MCKVHVQSDDGEGEGAGKGLFSFIFHFIFFFPALCETYALCVVATTGHAAWDCGASIKRCLGGRNRMNDGGLVMGAVGNIIVHVPY